MQALDRGEIGAFVESGFFYGRATSKRPHCAESDTPSGERITCLSNVREGMARHSIWPLTGRVGNAQGAICPDHAPAQFTTLAARKVVLVVVTPVTRPSRGHGGDWSPEEKSTLKFLAALVAAEESARGSTLRSFR